MNTLILDSWLVVQRGRHGGEMVNVVLGMFLLRCPTKQSGEKHLMSIRASKSGPQRRDLC